MTGLYEARKIVPVIDRSYPLREVPDALRYLGEGRVKGKIVITIKRISNSEKDE
jgi:NADPH:quinone reductase-like Zn-dependent oxidoreductase